MDDQTPLMDDDSYLIEDDHPLRMHWIRAQLAHEIRGLSLPPDMPELTLGEQRLVDKTFARWNRRVEQELR